MGELDLISIAEHCCAFEHIPQLADIPRPGVVAQRAQSRRTHALNVLSHLAVELVQKDGRESRNIGYPLPKRWQVDPNNAEAVIQVLPEKPISNRLFQILICR